MGLGLVGNETEKDRTLPLVRSLTSARAQLIWESLLLLGLVCSEACVFTGLEAVDFLLAGTVAWYRLVGTGFRLL